MQKSAMTWVKGQQEPDDNGTVRITFHELAVFIRTRLVAQISNLRVFLRIRTGGAEFSDREPGFLPLPSTGRGNEDEGCCDGETRRQWSKLKIQIGRAQH